MKKLLARMAATLLAAILLFGLVPATAFAAEPAGQTFSQNDLGKPGNLSWGENYTGFFTGVAGVSMYTVKLFQSDTEVYTATYNRQPPYEATHKVSLAPFINDSGLYHFVVACYDVDAKQTGEFAISADSLYVRPASALGQPTNITSRLTANNRAEVTWTPPANARTTDGYHVRLYKKDTNGNMQDTARFSYTDRNTSTTPVTKATINTNGPGEEYYIKLRILSSDINTFANGQYSDYIKVDPEGTGGNPPQDGGKQPGGEEETPTTPSQTVTSVRFPQAALRLARNAKFKLKATAYTSNGKTVPVTYTSNKPNVVSVTGSGVVAAKKTGSAVITASAQGKKATIRVKVDAKTAKKVKATSVKANIPKKMKAGQTRYVTGRYAPASAQGVKIAYKSSKKSVAAIDACGRLEAKRKGKATITVYSGGVSRKYDLTVT